VALARCCHRDGLTSTPCRDTAGLIMHISELRSLVDDMNHLIAAGVEPDRVSTMLAPWNRAVFDHLPATIRTQLLVEREARGKLQLSQVSTEVLLADLVAAELAARKAAGHYGGGFAPITVRSRRVAVLCCAVLCCAVLCCAVLCCAVLCCAVLCCAVLCCRVVLWAYRTLLSFLCLAAAFLRISGMSLLPTFSLVTLRPVPLYRRRRLSTVVVCGCVGRLAGVCLPGAVLPALQLRLQPGVHPGHGRWCPREQRLHRLRCQRVWAREVAGRVGGESRWCVCRLASSCVSCCFVRCHRRCRCRCRWRCRCRCLCCRWRSCARRPHCCVLCVLLSLSLPLLPLALLCSPTHCCVLCVLLRVQPFGAPLTAMMQVVADPSAASAFRPCIPVRLSVTCASLVPAVVPSSRCRCCCRQTARVDIHDKSFREYERARQGNFD
jgi:hypothetical protein